MATNGADLKRNQCPLCTMDLSSRQCLRRHWQRWHQEKTSSDLEEYLAEFDSRGKTHVCITCGKHLSRANILKEHQQKVHGLESLKRGGRFTCPFHSACTNEPLSDELPSFYHVKDLLEHCSSFHHEQLGKNKQKND